MFAIEELARKPEQRNNSLILVAIVLAGMVSVSFNGNSSYFGVIRIGQLSTALLFPAAMVVISCGIAGGLFSRLMMVSLAGRSQDWFSQLRRSSPVAFAAACGLGIAILGITSHGESYGSGYAHTRNMLESNGESISLFVLFKFIATWLTTWSGVPGGIFAPALTIGGALGNDVAQLTGYPYTAALIAMGMAGFLAAVTQAPMTAFIIVMEMVDGHALVLSLMTSAMVSSAIARLISTPLYPSLADLQLLRLPQPTSTDTKKGAPQGSKSLHHSNST